MRTETDLPAACLVLVAVSRLLGGRTRAPVMSQAIKRVRLWNDQEG